VGWQRAAEMAKHCEIWVITEECEFRDNIERYLCESGPEDNLHFRFVPRIIASERTWRILSELRPLYYLAYKVWHKRAYRVALDLCTEVHFDLVHQSTMCGFREPGQLWRLDVPFIWGPVGGTQNYPWRFLLQAGPVPAIKECARSAINNLQMRFTRRVQKASKRASAILTAIPAGQRYFERFHGVDAACMLDVGVNRVVPEPRRYRGRSRPLRLLWSGYFEHRKALQLLLYALAKIPEGTEYELRILGRGPRQKSWRRLARRLEVDDRCSWLGWVPYDVAMKQNAWADVLVFTSLRDTCGTVVIEALSQGLPVICLDHQGAGFVVTDRCGLKVPLTTPSEVISGLRDAIVKAASDNDMLEVLSQGAIDRAREFLWQIHGKRLAKLYGEVIEEHSISSKKGQTKELGR
jgi:glycosyltransferase involved in cell wall biosynthesis